MIEEALRTLGPLLDAIVNEAAVPRRIVLESAILDYLDLAVREASLRLPTTISFYDNVHKQARTITLTNKDEVLKLIAFMRELLDIAANNVDSRSGERQMGGVVVENIQAFPITLTIQSIVVQLLQQGIFGEIETFKVSATDLLRERQND